MVVKFLVDSIVLIKKICLILFINLFELLPFICASNNGRLVNNLYEVKTFSSFTSFTSSSSLPSVGMSGMSINSSELSWL